MVDFSTLLNKKKLDLELEYAKHMENKEYEEAYYTLGDLMRYRLIDREDIRLNKKNRMELMDKICYSYDHKFAIDYAKDYNFVRDWIYCDLEKYFCFDIETEGYESIRVEGANEGYIKIPSRKLKIRVSMLNTFMKCKNGMEGIKSIYSLYNKNILVNETILSKLAEGEYKIYEVEVESTCLSRYKHLGYILVYMDNGDIVVKVILNKEKVLSNHINVVSIYKTIGKLFYNSISYKRRIAKEIRVLYVNLQEAKG